MKDMNLIDSLIDHVIGDVIVVYFLLSAKTLMDFLHTQSQTPLPQVTQTLFTLLWTSAPWRQRLKGMSIAVSWNTRYRDDGVEIETY